MILIYAQSINIKKKQIYNRNCIVISYDCFTASIYSTSLCNPHSRMHLHMLCLLVCNVYEYELCVCWAWFFKLVYHEMSFNTTLIISILISEQLSNLRSNRIITVEIIKYVVSIMWNNKCYCTIIQISCITSL